MYAIGGDRLDGLSNGQIMDSIITNYSANDTRRVDMVVGVSYDDDLDKVRKTVEELVAADDRILDEPACTIAVKSSAPSCGATAKLGVMKTIFVMRGPLRLCSRPSGLVCLR